MEIIVTVGPESLSKATLELLSNAGATSFRINLSHSTRTSLKYYYNYLLSAGISPCLDTQGPQIRTSGVCDEIFLKKGSFVNISISDTKALNTQNVIYLSGCSSNEIFKLNAFIRIDYFEGVILKVVSSDIKEIVCVVIAEGYVKENKAVDIIGCPMKNSSLSNLDQYAINQYKGKGLKSVYVSFANDAEIIVKTKSMLDESTRVIAKIETIQALTCLEEICSVSDAVLIDRGDLSREVSISLLPAVVRSIIHKCKVLETPVYVATSILDSLIKGSLPNRSEISDLWSLLLLEVDGIVLAAEVAIGQSPVESVTIVKYMYELYKKNNSLDLCQLANLTKEYAINESKSFNDETGPLFYWM